MRPVRRIASALTVLSFAAAYLGYVFQLHSGIVWRFGLGDWIDPYFINYLLEHWYTAVVRFRDPTSPPMFFPVSGTLGYSHGLMLYAPFYVAIRWATHPFTANTLALFAAMVTGTVCLYALLRSALRATFLESMVFTALFVTSPNVVNATIGVWTQRASVFLIPPILLLGWRAWTIADPARRFAVAALAGALATSLFTHDFYTAQFAFSFAFAAVAGVLLLEQRITIFRHFAVTWTGFSTWERGLVVVAAALMTWTGLLWFTTGIDVEWAGLRIRSHDWMRPAVLAAAVAAYLLVRWSRRRRIDVDAWSAGALAGALAGAAFFLWIYLPVYRAHPSFAEADLLSRLTTVRPRGWRTAGEAIDAIQWFASWRSFLLISACAVLATRTTVMSRAWRMRVWWFALVSALVLVLPLTYRGFSPWRTLLEPLPGFSAIRDPTRIIFVFDLAAVLVGAAALAHMRPRSGSRVGLLVIAAVLTVYDFNRDTLRYARPHRVFARVVEAPITIDPSCRAFFVLGASADYMARSDNMSALYGVDAMFLSLRLRMPTLNGFSAWAPEGWDLAHPHNPGYLQNADAWIATHQLTDVCALDIEQRRMVTLKSLNH